MCKKEIHLGYVCNHWTFHRLRGGRTTCSFMELCEKKEPNCPLYPDSDIYCGSGSSDCDDNNFPCDPIDYQNDGSGLQVHWHSEHLPAPYQDNIPIGRTVSAR